MHILFGIESAAAAVVSPSGIGTLLNTISVGPAPTGICFDGTNVWCLNSDSTVTKILASTGAVLNTFSYPIGNAQTGGIYTDGTIIYIPTGYYGQIVRMAQDGTILTTFNVGGPGNNTTGGCSDGTNIWSVDYSQNYVSELLASTGATVNTSPDGTGPYTACFDGKYIWIPNSVDNTLTQILASTGAVINTINIGTNPIGVCYDRIVLPNVPSGTPTGNIWVVNALDNTLTRITAATGAITGTFMLSGTSYIIWARFDGTYLWTNAPADNLVVQVSTSGAQLNAFTVGNNPADLCYGDGAIWVVNNSDNTVMQLED